MQGINWQGILYKLIIGIISLLFIYLFINLFPFYNVVLHFLGKLFLPFIIAGLIAYLLHPVINKLDDYKINKGLGVILIYLIFFGGFGYLIYRTYPIILHQLGDLNAYLPQLTEMYEKTIYELYERTSFLPETFHDRLDVLIRSMEQGVEQLLGRVLGRLTEIFDLILILTILPVLVFYFLKDYVLIKNYFKKYIPIRFRPRAEVLGAAIDHSLGGYIRGQVLVSLFVGLVTLVIFHLLGIKYALLLAIIMAITNIIPYFGPIIGAVPAVAIAYTMSGNSVVYVLIAIFSIQLVESNLLSPYIMGKSINIHPLAILFALLLGSELAGIIGMILAVPLMTIINTSVVQMLAMKREL